MNPILAGFFGGLGLAFVAKNFAMTLRAYRGLPVSVPDHFDGYGEPDSYGPRPVTFVTMLASLVAWGVSSAGVAGLIAGRFSMRSLSRSFTCSAGF